MKKGHRDKSQEEKKPSIKTAKMEVEKAWISKHRLEWLGMPDSLTNTTVCSIMRQCLQSLVGDRKGKELPETVSGHA